MQPLRASLLWASQNRRIESIVRASSAMRPLVSRFMPGETIGDVVLAVQALRAEQTPSIITYLGENVSSDAAADQTVAEYERLLAALTAASADAHVSIKLTQFGWDLDLSLIHISEPRDGLLSIRRQRQMCIRDSDQTVAEYERLLAALTAASADAHVSIKLTQFGWDLD